MVVTLTGGTIIDWLAVWQAAQPAGIISATPTQYVFGTFYGMICVIEGGLFVQLFLTVIKRTNYSTGESEL